MFLAVKGSSLPLLQRALVPLLLESDHRRTRLRLYRHVSAPLCVSSACSSQSATSCCLDSIWGPPMASKDPPGPQNSKWHLGYTNAHTYIHIHNTHFTKLALFFIYFRLFFFFCSFVHLYIHTHMLLYTHLHTFRKYTHMHTQTHTYTSFYYFFFSIFILYFASCFSPKNCTKKIVTAWLLNQAFWPLTILSDQFFLF